MRSSIAALGAVLVAVTVVAPAQALTTVNVRIEGKAETLFEGKVATEPHGVRSTSDRIAADKLRKCNGINVNDPGNTVPGVTPTAVGADAMTLIGETFDGQWYKQYEDYFVTRWGPDLQDAAADAYWGIVVNEVYTSVGGCQYELDDGDEVLWAYDAFDHRPELALFPEASNYAAGERPVAINGVAAGAPVPVEVVSYADDEEATPPAAPARAGSSGFEGAAVAPVSTNAKGFEQVQSSGPEVVTTGPGGKASVAFDQPGWHRIKATVGAPGLETAIRSNRLDVCVTGGAGPPVSVEGVSSCNQLPPADLTRTAAATVGEIEVEGQGAPATAAPTKPPSATTPSPPEPNGTLQVSVPKLNRSKAAAGTIGVSWSLLSAGPGVKKWTVDSLTVGAKGAAWVTRASGATKTKATVHLPRGHTYRLRFRITDAAGSTSTLSLGKVKVPPRRDQGGHPA